MPGAWASSSAARKGLPVKSGTTTPPATSSTTVPFVGTGRDEVDDVVRLGIPSRAGIDLLCGAGTYRGKIFTTDADEH